MSTVSLNLPESLYKQVCKLAQEDGISLNQFIATAVAEEGSLE
jgi:predicted HicB family RNase H-like nuclease